MNRSLWQYFIMIMVTMTFLAACGSSSSKSGENQSIQGSSSEGALNNSLGDVYDSPEGGYSFQLIPDYDFEDNSGIIYLSPEGADPNTGPMLILIGGLNDVEKTADDLLTDFKTGMESDLDITRQEKARIGGKEGLRIEYKGFNNGEKVEGEATFVAVGPTQVFSLIGIYPAGKYGKQERDQYQSVKGTVQFHEVSWGAVSGVSGQSGSGGDFRQWAAYAKSSSEYSSTESSALQATGKPDTLSCSDAATAWKPASGTTTEWLEVFFPAPVLPTGVDIYETYHPSQIVKVEVMDDTATYHVVYSGEPVQVACPSILSIKIPDASYFAIGVRITVDQSRLNLPGAMIDAVEMAGLAEGTVEESAAAPGSGGPETSASQPPSAGQPVQSAGGSVPANASGSWSYYTVADGLPENMTRSIAVSRDGTVWIGTGSKGAASLKDGKITIFSQADGLGSPMVTSLAAASNGAVWAGTGWGAARYTGSGWENFTTDQGLVSNDVKSVAIAPDGSVWVGTSSGVSMFDGQDWQSYKTPDSFPKREVTDIAFGLDGTAWFANPEGLISFKNGDWQLYTQADGLSYKFVTSVAVAPDGAVWAATAGQGANRFDGSAWQVFRKDEGLSFNTQDIAVAADGSLWFSTTGDGVFRYNGEAFEKWTSADGLPSDWVDYLAVGPDGSVWAGFRDAGIGRFGK